MGIFNTRFSAYLLIRCALHVSLCCLLASQKADALIGLCVRGIAAADHGTSSPSGGGVDRSLAAIAWKSRRDRLKRLKIVESEFVKKLIEAGVHFGHA